MRKVMIAFGAALMLAPAAAPAQTAAENFSYKEPSGMFGEGHAKWQLYKFIHEDSERREALARQRELATGSIAQPTYSVQISPTGVPRARRPGEPDPRRNAR
jgi:opacity protein-like surface antigen